MQILNYKFDILGNFSSKMKEMVAGTKELTDGTKEVRNRLQKLSQEVANVDWGIQGVRNIVSGFQEVAGAGVSLDSQMHDLSAIAGVTGDALKEIEGYARDAAKAFGTDASDAVTGYKLLLSQLSPELGKYPEALKAMGTSIQTTAKLMGGDGVAAAEVLTTAMNQYGVSLEDPMEASREMARMMNVMAAAGQAGSAELPAIKVALEQCGMAAKAANVSFEETNAAIQVLDKAGKKGSEGGVALRNVMTVLSQGRFLPKDTREELEKAGIDVLALGDESKSLHDRLEMLKPILSDSALFTKMFGRESASAARALVQGTESLQDFTDAVTGTKSAEEQAQTIMDSYAERQKRINQQIEDFKIGMFQATGDVTLWLGALGETLVPLAQLMPLLTTMGSLMMWIKGLQWASMWGGIIHFMRAARIQMVFLNRELLTGQFVSNGFAVNMLRATLATLRFGTVGVFQALKGIGALIASFITGGAASVTFSTVASGAFATFKLSAVTACRAVGVAIRSIPIVGWVAMAVEALMLLYEHVAWIKELVDGLVDSFKRLFGSVSEAVQKAKPKVYRQHKKTVYKSRDGKVFNTLAEARAHDRGEDKPVDVLNGTLSGTGTSAGTSAGGAGGSSDGSKIRSVTVNVGKLVEKLELHTTTISEGAGRVKDMITEALLGALNDANLAVG